MPNISLSGTWQWAEDPRGEADRSGMLTRRPRKGLKRVDVPGIWNLAFPDYHGPAVYYRTIRIPQTWAARRTFLVFDGCNYLAHVYLDGRKIGSHEGGYIGFELEVTDHVRPGEDQLLTVWVIHSPPKQNIADTHLEDVASSKELWYYSYAGLWGTVRLESRPSVFVDDVFAAPNLAKGYVDITMSVNGSAFAGGEWTLRDGKDRRVAAGPCKSRWRIPIRHPRPWSPQDPHLYTLEVALPNGSRKSIRFGMRDIGVRRDGFFLNGKPLYLKGVLLQPNYPETLINAPGRAFVRKELRRIRDGGFNLIRAHIKPMLPYALDLADEMGLLVYEEPALGWIRKSPHLVRRALSEVSEMIARDRNHPSIICWGVVNENGGTYKAIRSSVCRRIHRLDPTRPAIGDSGAYALVPQGGWSGTTHIKLPRTMRQEPFEDAHMYIRAPILRKAFDFLRLAGNPDRMPDTSEFTLQERGANAPWLRRLRRNRPRIFLSEYGYGGLMNFQKAVRRYKLKTCQDARQYVEFGKSLDKDLKARGIWKDFGSMEELLRQVNSLQAEGDRKQTEAIRLNPLITGYVITQFNDVAWECSAGLTDVWRDPKPAYYAMQNANRPVIGVLQPEAITLEEGKAVRARAWVVSEADRGALRIEISLHAPDGSILGKSERTTKTSSRVRSAGTHRLGRVGEAGTYRLRFRVLSSRKEVYRGSEDIFVFPRCEDSNEAPGMAAVLAAESMSVKQWKRRLARVKAGARLLVTGITPAVADTLNKSGLLPWKLKCTVGHGGFCGQFHYLRNVPELRGLPKERIADTPYTGILPDWTLNEIPEARVLGGSFTVSIFRQPGDEIRQLGSMNWFADIMDLPLGSGMLRICQYDLWKDDPVARIMRRGLT